MYNIAILWATWAVWKEMIECLYNKKIPVKELRLLASERSAWKKQETPFWEIIIQAVSEDAFENIDFALFSAWGSLSKIWAEKAIAKWCRVIDNSSAFRYENDVPLVIPEINPEAIKDAKIISNPNCTTAIAAVALYPLHKEFKLKKVIISTYQATSWAGAKWMQELLDTTQDYFVGKPLTHSTFAHPIAFNVIPHIDAFQENLYTKEEMKVTWETHKIFNDPSIKLSCTAVRIPTLRAHSEAITIECEKDIPYKEAQEILSKALWVDLVDNPENLEYPMPLNASWKYNIEAGRVRQSVVFENKWIDFFVSWDQLLKWAALNAVQILEIIISQ